MLFHSSIRKELARSFGATLVVLFTIVVTMMLIRILALATAGSVDPKEVVLVLGYTVLGRLHIILTMSLFIAVVSVLSRMHRDSEMVIWMGSGRGLAGLLAPIFRFAWPLLATASVLVFLALGQPAGSRPARPLCPTRRPATGGPRSIPGRRTRPTCVFHRQRHGERH
jgi:lipopolysaccharide export system permease protein